VRVEIALFIREKGHKNRRPQLINGNSPNATSENGSENFSTNIISQGVSDVK
jgi:hypothetical protein